MTNNHSNLGYVCEEDKSCCDEIIEGHLNAWQRELPEMPNSCCGKIRA